MRTAATVGSDTVVEQVSQPDGERPLPHAADLGLPGQAVYFVEDVAGFVLEPIERAERKFQVEHEPVVEGVADAGVHMPGHDISRLGGLST